MNKRRTVLITVITRVRALPNWFIGRSPISRLHVQIIQL